MSAAFILCNQEADMVQSGSDRHSDDHGQVHVINYEFFLYRLRIAQQFDVVFTVLHK